MRRLPPPLASCLLCALLAGTAPADDAPVVDGTAVAVEDAPDHLVIAGEHAPVSTKVVTWEAQEGFDGHTPGPEGPRYGERKITDETLAKEVAAEGWDPERLARQVDQFVLHFDGCCTSRQCAHVLEDRGLSVHFMLDADGTIYQTVDLTARAWHATIANDRSIGIEIANPGAAAEARAPEFLARYYMKTADGWPLLCPPAGADPAWPVEFVPRPARKEPVLGPIHREMLAQYDFTPQQYESLAQLIATLHHAFPKIRLEIPREADGKPMMRQLTPEEFAKFQGVLGHYHVQGNKVDPGPAMQWDKLIQRAKEIDEEAGKEAARDGAPAPAEKP